MPKLDPIPEPSVSEAAGTISFALGPDGKALGAFIEEAMIKATEQAAAEGVTDPEEVLSYKLAARTQAKAEFAAYLTQQLAAANEGE